MSEIESARNLVLDGKGSRNFAMEVSSPNYDYFSLELAYQLAID
jgi:hypothetical protein